jgi:antitoxin PrlF
MHMNRMTGKVTDRGQVTIPKRLRDRLGIRPGEVLEFEEGRGGQLLARKAPARDVVDAVYGILRLDETSDEFVERLRGESDAA